MPTFDPTLATRAQLEEAYRIIAEKYEAAKARLSWVYRLLANPGLQGNQKLYLIALDLVEREARKKGVPEHEGKPRIYRRDLARVGGMSEQSVSAQGKKAADNGLINYACKTFRNVDTGETQKETYISLDQTVYEHPGEVSITTVRQGGKRVPTCSHCGSTDVEEVVTFICHHCGVQQNESEIVYMSEEGLAYEQELLAETAEESGSVNLTLREDQPAEPTDKDWYVIAHCERENAFGDMIPAEWFILNAPYVSKEEAETIQAAIVLNTKGTDAEWPEANNSAKIVHRDELADYGLSPLNEKPSRPPTRDCMPCSYRHGYPMQAWQWDQEQRRWVCAFQDTHNLPKLPSLEGGVIDGDIRGPGSETLRGSIQHLPD